MMKRSLFVLLALVAMSLSVQAQKAEKVIAAYIEAVGGADTWEGIHTVTTEGSMKMQGMDFPIKVIQKQPHMVKTTMSVMGQEIVQAYNGKVGWTINPMMGSTTPTELPEEQLKQFGNQRILDPLMDIEGRGVTVEYVGKETIDGDKYEVLSVTNDGITSRQFFDVKTGLRMMTFATVEAMGSTQEVKIVFEEYTEVDNVWIPFSVNTFSAGTVVTVLKLDKVTLNDDVADAEFDMPSSDN
ncbi:hypothetical protein [Pontibacter sp. G13]|uniref:LolA family protein n=1 Tax=Pontibacter sp. G13 TaxID=3074898 RepID=UPI00288A4E96|nr:hypothetical protein [Pontibacter sp. G13]WNJ20109.1 hypothetical protein RJD25_06455 [Pontibacter sp. G13]